MLCFDENHFRISIKHVNRTDETVLQGGDEGIFLSRNTKPSCQVLLKCLCATDAFHNRIRNDSFEPVHSVRASCSMHCFFLWFDWISCALLLLLTSWSTTFAVHQDELLAFPSVRTFCTRHSFIQVWTSITIPQFKFLYIRESCTDVEGTSSMDTWGIWIPRSFCALSIEPGCTLWGSMPCTPGNFLDSHACFLLALLGLFSMFCIQALSPFRRTRWAPISKWTCSCTSTFCKSIECPWHAWVWTGIQGPTSGLTFVLMASFPLSARQIIRVSASSVTDTSSLRVFVNRGFTYANSFVHRHVAEIHLNCLPDFLFLGVVATNNNVCSFCACRNGTQNHQDR